ncbi:hypothetical protein OAQ99_06895, partial [Candidatus Kapabacteria bacterium]|nr:hypothetical protein [Candidatus Kapabacteria bacterium]
TFNIKSEFRQLLLNFNKKADHSNFSKKIDIVKKVWQQKSNDLKNVKLEFSKELEQIASEIKKISSEVDNYDNKLDNAKQKLIAVESDLLAAKNKRKIFNHKQPVIITLSLALVSLSLLFFGFLGDLITEFDSNYYIILLILGLAVSIYNFLPLRKIVIRQKRKEEIEKIDTDIAILNKQKKELNNVSSIIKADLKASRMKIDELNKDINSFYESLNSVNTKLDESYCD